MSEPKQENFRCGMVSIVGRPNVGKSTLLNKIIGEKIAIVSPVPQTTRNQVRGIYNEERGQIIFLDTPGLHLGKDKLDAFMNQSSLETIHEADCVIHLVDISRKIGREEENVVDKLKSVNKPIILGLNKIDLKGVNIPEYIALWEKAKGQKITEMQFFTMLTLSGQEGTHVATLLDILFDYLPQGPALYPSDIVCDVPQKMVIADVIREKFFMIMREELPHSIGVTIEDMQKVRKETLLIKALVLVERDTQKEIVIGKQGQILKNVGTLARVELEELLETKVFLEIYVKTKKKWRDNLSLLQELGYGH
ncbi:MAG TPA: GTPase Era [Candidatus Omnitrophica bacterium]|nr:MAG: GTPase Era [Omnitrophica WOR_2 bacterium GWA2_45_18]OGX19501.1 MAG: GTPase Era [Omnitrophica WOR_2 bacterium GWC2_45_7]HBR15024.1 GTPase Era [Candidatus Omnitrophota bacterium]